MQPDEGMPEIFCIQMILEITRRVGFLLCGYQSRCAFGDTVCLLVNDMQESQRDFIISFVRTRYELYTAFYYRDDLKEPA